MKISAQTPEDLANTFGENVVGVLETEDVALAITECSSGSGLHLLTLPARRQPVQFDVNDPQFATGSSAYAVFNGIMDLAKYLVDTYEDARHYATGAELHNVLVESGLVTEQHVGYEGFCLSMFAYDKIREHEARLALPASSPSTGGVIITTRFDGDAGVLTVEGSRKQIEQAKEALVQSAPRTAAL